MLTPLKIELFAFDKKKKLKSIELFERWVYNQDKSM